MARFGKTLALAAVAATVVGAAADARTPLVSVEPRRGIPGQRVVVTGHEFCGLPRCGRVRIQLYGAVVATGVRVSAGGTWAGRIKVPGGAPTGDVGLVATQALANGSEIQAFADFEMAVRLKTQAAARSSAAHGRTAVSPDSRDGEAPSDRTRGSGRPNPASSPLEAAGKVAAASVTDDSGSGSDRELYAVGAVVALLLGAAAARFVAVRVRRS